MSRDTSKAKIFINFVHHEYSHHRWEYQTFTIIVFICFIFAFLSEITHLNDAINYFVGGSYSLAQEIRLAPLEHFAPNTIAYGTTFLYLLVSSFRIICGTNQTAATWFNKNLLIPLTYFYSTLCRAMLGGLIGITILTFAFDFSSYLWIFFLFSFIYPIIIMLVIQSMSKLTKPIKGLKFDKGALGTRVVGLLMIVLALLSGLAVYILNIIGKTLI